MTAPAPEIERKSLRELRESKGTLFAKNNTRNKITCNTDKVTFSLAPKGKDDSIKIVPKECLDQPGFQKLWMAKKIAISDDPAMEEEIALLMGGHVAMPRKVSVMGNDGKMIEVEPVVEEPSNRRDLTFKLDEKGQPISVKCLIGSETVFQTEGQIKAGQPPLCPVHESESYRVASTPQPDGSWTHQLVM